MKKAKSVWFSLPVKAFLMLIFAGSLVATSAIAQPDRSDEKPENLTVLPETMTMQQVRRVMFQFTSGLGVRCSHCHVGEEGKPLSTYDFASDDKEAKETTRAMMRMVSTINDDHITQLPDGDERITVTCQTCHHGVAKPQLLEDVLAEYLPDHGAEETLMYYETLKEEYYGASSYDFQEGSLNKLAQRLISMEEPQTALAFLKLNAEMYPESSDTYALMGEAHMAMEDKDAAIKNLEKAVELAPRNRRAVQRLTELKGEG